MLKIEGVSASYGGIRALADVDLAIRPGEVVALIGANGAGKTTLIHLVSGLITPGAGKVLFQGREIHGWSPERIVAQGISQVPEGRLLFGPLTVRENLELGAFRRRRESPHTVASDLERVLALFPVLAERLQQRAGTLSGGEQQMLAIGRALMARPFLMMLDEPSLGLAPLVVRAIMETIQRLRREGTTVLLVEQNARAALAISDRAYVLQNGRVQFEGLSSALLASDRICRAYLGESA